MADDDGIALTCISHTEHGLSDEQIMKLVSHQRRGRVMATKKSRKKSKKVLNQSPKQGPVPPPKPLTRRQKFMQWLRGDVSGG